jgi:hypothetical protein
LWISSFASQLTSIAARVRATASHFAGSELAEANQSLNAALADAKSHGFTGYQLDARLALGEIKVKSGIVAEGRKELEAFGRKGESERIHAHCPPGRKCTEAKLVATVHYADDSTALGGAHLCPAAAASVRAAQGNTQGVKTTKGEFRCFISIDLGKR